MSEIPVELGLSIAALSQALQRDPWNADLLTEPGELYAEAGLDDEAIEMLERTHALRPLTPRTLHVLGLAYLRTDRTADVVAALEEAVRGAPDDVRLLVDLGWAYREAERFREALDTFDRVIRLDPHLAAGHYGHGMCCVSLDDYAAAAAALRETVRLDPSTRWRDTTSACATRCWATRPRHWSSIESCGERTRTMRGCSWCSSRSEAGRGGSPFARARRSPHGTGVPATHATDPSEREGALRRPPPLSHK